jgi:DNA repair photolyase
MMEVDFDEGVDSLRSFIEGKRTQETNWVDWDIPIHWGGMSDPFQPLERKYKRSLPCLELLAKTKYPVVISTKGKLLCEDPYLSLLKECNAVVQISIVSPELDDIEPGAPTFEKRLIMLEKLNGNCKRLIVRCQPYAIGLVEQVCNAVHEYAKRGVYGVILEGLKRNLKRPGLVKVGNDWCFPLELLRKDFLKIKRECHKHGLEFYAAENRLRRMGDSPSCCGVVGLEGFVPHTANMSHMDEQGNIVYTDKMKEKGTAKAFSAAAQESVSHDGLSKMSFAEAIEAAKNTDIYLETMGYKRPSGKPMTIQIDLP